MALKRTVLETYRSQRGRRYGKRHWLKTMASHVGHVGSGHNASGLCLDNGPTSWTKSRIVMPQQCWTSIETIGAGDIVKSRQGAGDLDNTGHWSLSWAEMNTDSISWTGLWSSNASLTALFSSSSLTVATNLQKKILLLYSSTITRKHFVFEYPKLRGSHVITPTTRKHGCQDARSGDPKCVPANI